jgi:ABC-2 type transport system permease protein
MSWSIALHEWRRLRAGLMFWLLLAFAQLTIAWLAFAQLEAFARIAPQLKASGTDLGVMDLVVTPSLGSLVLILLLAAPLLAMGGIAGETRSGRLSLWLSAPLASRQLVIGKVLGLGLALLALLASALLTLALLGLGIDIDWPRLALAAVTLLLLCLWLAAVVILLSCLFDHPAAALAASYGVLLFAWLLDSISPATAAWHWLALLPHVEPGLQGLWRSTDLVFFASTTTAALLLAVALIARRRGEL